LRIIPTVLRAVYAPRLKPEEVELVAGFVVLDDEP
jgi:hypothetical protein